MCPFSSVDRQRCWELWFGDSNVGVCKTKGCTNTIYRNAGPDSPMHWHAGHIRASANGGSDNYRRNCAPLCDECNLRMGTNHANPNKRY
jgi:hypothetical protein